MSEWQHIETAPRGHDVLVYCADTDEQFVAFWSMNPLTDDTAFTYARFRDADGDVSSVLCRPTHWMPLPNPPSDE